MNGFGPTAPSRPLSRAARRLRAPLLGAIVTALGAGCATVPDKDYSAFRANMPRSILVLPPVNESIEAEASYSYLSVASEAIGEQGYYVYPVAVIDAFMRENGLPDPEDMHAVPLDRIGEIIGADAVLYITLEEFGQKFELLSSTTRVRARASLVDVDTGQELWNNTVNHAAGSTSSGGGLLAEVLTAAITQVGRTANDAVHGAARLANRTLVATPGEGLLYGPRHPDFGTEELPGSGEDAPGAEGTGGGTSDEAPSAGVPEVAPESVPADTPS